MRSSTQVVEVVSQVTSQVFRTKTGDLVKVYEVIGRRGLTKLPYEELINFLSNVGRSLKSLEVAMQWFIQKEPLNYQQQIEYYRNKIMNSSFELPQRAHEELEAEIERLKYLELGHSVERYYVVLIASEHEDMNRAIQWMNMQQSVIKNRSLSEEESLAFFHQLYN